MKLNNTLYSKDNGIARVIINRPEARNALDISTRAELRSDNSVRLAIITGAGEEAFISGADVGMFKEATPVTIEEHTSTLGQALYTSIENLDIPVIAIAGSLGTEVEALYDSIGSIFGTVRSPQALSQVLSEAEGNLTRTARNIAATLAMGNKLSLK